MSWRYAFNLDQPSAWLAEKRPQRLAFLWDNPAGSMADPVRLGEVASYFLHRHGAPDARVLILNAARLAPPRIQVTWAARNGRADALIWISDANLPRTRSPTDPMLLKRLGWTCREFGHRRAISVLACRAGRST